MQINSTTQMASFIQKSQATTQVSNQQSSSNGTSTLDSIDDVQTNDRVSTPESPANGEKLETYAQIKKTQMQYQVAADMVNIASGNNQGISAPTAAYLANNDQARETALQHKTMQQQYQSIQTYQEQTENYQNTWVV